MTRIETPTTELCMLRCLCLVLVIWVPFWEHLVPIWSLSGGVFRIILAHLEAHWRQCWANLGQHGQTLLQEGSPTHLYQRSPPILAIFADLGPMLGPSWNPCSAPKFKNVFSVCILGPQNGLVADFTKRNKTVVKDSQMDTITDQ